MQDYNFRSYALRRVRDGFREGKNASDAQVPQLMARVRQMPPRVLLRLAGT